MSFFEFMNIMMAKDLAEKEEHERKERERMLYGNYSNTDTQEDEEKYDPWDWTKKRW